MYLVLDTVSVVKGKAGIRECQKHEVIGEHSSLGRRPGQSERASVVISSWAGYKNGKELKRLKGWVAGTSSAFQSWVWFYFFLARSSPNIIPTLFSWPGVRTQGEPGSIWLLVSGLATSTDFLRDLEQNRNLLSEPHLPNMLKG